VKGTQPSILDYQQARLQKKQQPHISTYTHERHL